MQLRIKIALLATACVEMVSGGALILLSFSKPGDLEDDDYNEAPSTPIPGTGGLSSSQVTGMFTSGIILASMSVITLVCIGCIPTTRNHPAVMNNIHAGVNEGSILLPEVPSPNI